MSHTKRYSVHSLNTDRLPTSIDATVSEDKDSWYWHVGDTAHYEGRNEMPEDPVVCVAMRGHGMFESAIPKTALPSEAIMTARGEEGRIDVFVAPKDFAVTMGVELNDMGF
jgi:hypothetical protein